MKSSKWIREKLLTPIRSVVQSLVVSCCSTKIPSSASAAWQKKEPPGGGMNTGRLYQQDLAYLSCKIIGSAFNTAKRNFRRGDETTGRFCASSHRDD
jgi:hypothetical protein